MDCYQRISLFFLFLLVLAAGCVSKLDIISPSEIVENPERFGGRNITVEGKIDSTDTKCTMLQCSDSDPCCNTCSSNLVVEGNKSVQLSGYYDGKRIGCNGTNCDMDCTPVKPGEKYYLRGNVKMFDGTPYIELYDYEVVGD